VGSEATEPIQSLCLIPLVGSPNLKELAVAQVVSSHDVTDEMLRCVPQASFEVWLVPGWHMLGYQSDTCWLSSPANSLENLGIVWVNL
jgi:hypothetical protein